MNRAVKSITHPAGISRTLQDENPDYHGKRPFRR